MSDDGSAVTGPLMVATRSGSEPPPPLEPTWVVTVSDVLKVVADLVPVTLAVLFSVVPLGTFTTPRIVTVHDWKPWRVPALRRMRLPSWPQLPTVLVVTSALVPSTPVRPVTWSARLTSVTLDPPVLVTTIV